MSADHADLEALMSEAMPARKAPAEQAGNLPDLSAPKYPYQVGQAIKRINYSHKGMIDLILANPGITQNEIATQIGYSASWVSLVMSSDAFQAELQARSEQIIDPTLKLTVEQRLKGVMVRSLSILEEKLKNRPEDIPDNLVVRALEASAKAAGYGSKVSVQVNTQNVQNNHLEILGDNLVKLMAQKRAEVSADEQAIDIGVDSND